MAYRQSERPSCKPRLLWTNVGLDAATLSSIEFASIALRRNPVAEPPSLLMGGHHSIQPVQVAAPTETSVTALLRKASSNISTDARTGTYHQTNRFHVRSLLNQAQSSIDS
jgi:hypothetical protein